MAYNTKNYTEQGGEKTVIGGTLEFTDDAKVENFPGGGSDSGYTLPAATKSTLGGVLAVDNIENCAATDVAGINDYINSYLLVRLRSAGILKD